MNHLARSIFLLVVVAVAAAVAAGQNQGLGAIVAVDEAIGGSGVSGGEQTTYAGGRKRGTRQSKTPVKKPAAPVQRNPGKWDGFVVGDKYTFLNFEVISADKPIYRREAKENGASGLVQVEVLIDTTGRVLTAKGRTGNKLLWPEAERAALASRFNRPTVYGKPARAVGFLVYRFGDSDD